MHTNASGSPLPHIKAHLQGTHSLHTKPTLQKSLNLPTLLPAVAFQLNDKKSTIQLTNMKKITTIILLFLVSHGISQDLVIPKKEFVEKKNKNEQTTKGVSPTTALLLIEFKEYQKQEEIKAKSSKEIRQINDSNIIVKYGLINKNQITYANVFLLVKENFKSSKLKTYGFLSGSSTKTILTGLAPVDKIELISTHPSVKYISIGDLAKPTMDSARNKTRVNLIHQGFQLSQSYFGDGVVVGIVDKGIDYTHPNFYDGNTSNYRIKRVWEQSATTGTPPSGFFYGRELTTQSAILAAARDNTTGSHGTHVGGIAAGGGGANTTFRGIAPKSDIVFVSSDGITSKIYDGVVYIMNYAASVGKPCVINLSWGGHYGPHDGTSWFDQASASIVGAGKILVGSAGNSGLDSIYLEKTYSNTDTTLLSFIKFPSLNLSTNGTSYIDIWGVANQNFKVAVNIFNTSTNQYEDYTNYYSANTSQTVTIRDTLYDNDPLFRDKCYVEIVTGIDPLNNKPRAQLSINNTDQDDNYRHILVEVIAKNTQTKAWIYSGDYSIFSTRGYSGSVRGGSTSSTIAELGGTGNAIISVGAFTAKNNYTALNGSFQSIDFPVSVGAIAPFSSKGPTADGRTKPDITAPGNVVISSVNSYDNTYTNTTNNVVAGVTNGTRNWYFGSMQGTSMAAPVVTGVIALWLQANPNLTPTLIKTYLKDSAITDFYTGTIPSNGNNTWGWGKVDAYGGLKRIIGIALPLSLLDFTATKIPNKVILAWSTSQELNTSKFEVERSITNNVWTKIGSVYAKNSVTQNEYSFIDEAPKSLTNYYRLKMLDKDGKFTYSPIRSVAITSNATPYVLAPNPAKSATTIYFNTPISKAEISIYDVQGKQIFINTYNETSKNKIDLNTSNFLSGVYIVSIKTNERTYNEKLIISH